MRKILAIDNQVADLNTIKDVIKNKISDCNVLTALSGQNGIEIAIKEQPDTILLNIIMPEMDGFETCKRLKENDLTKHIPILMLSSIDDSESRVKGFKIGADAFLSKPIDAIELTAQVNVMLRIKGAEDKLRSEKELINVKIKERTTELKKSESQLRQIIDLVPHLIFVKDETGKFEIVNKATAKIFGTTVEDLTGRRDSEFVATEEEMEHFRADDLEVIHSEKTKFIPEEPIYDSENNIRYLQTTKVPFKFSATKKPSLLGVAVDITKQKEAEKEIQKLSTAVEQSPSVIVITNLDGTIEYANPKFSELTGYTSKEVIGENPRILKSGEQSKKIYKEMWEAISSGKEWHGEFHNKKKNGDLFWESAIMAPIFDKQGQITNYIKIAEDITKRRETEIALKSSEERLKIIFESAPDAYYLSDLKGTFLDGNKAAEELIGYKKEELIGKNFLNLKLLSTKNLVIAAKTLAKSAMGNKTGPDEFFLNRKDGTKVAVEISTFPVKIKNKTVILGIARDITKRKQQNKELSEQRQSLSHIVEGTNAGTWDWNIQTGELVLNEQWAKIMGRTLKELEPISVKTWEENTHPDDRAMLNDLLKKHFNKEVDYYDAEFRQLHKDGHWIWINARGKVINWDENGKPLRMSGTHIEITDQKEAKEKLRQSYEQHKMLLDLAPDAFFHGDMEGNFITTNLSAIELTGYTYDELMKMNMNDLFSERELKQKPLDYKSLDEGQKTYSTRELIKKDKSKLIIEMRSRKMQDGTYQAFIRDITERKRAEEIQKILFNISNAVIQTDDIKEFIHFVQNELGKIIDTKNFYVALYDSKTNTISSPYMADEKDSFTIFPAGKTLTYYVIKTQKPLLATKERLKELEDSGDIEDIGSDSEIWLGVPLKIEGKVTGVFAVQSYTDEHAYDEADMEVLEFIADQISISIERKTAEDLLRKSEERFNLAMKASKDGLYDWNLKTKDIYYSKRWKSMLGYTDDELPNDISVWESLSHKEEKEASLNKLKEAIEQKVDHYDVEFRMKHKQGHWVNILSRAQIIYNEKGEGIRAVGTHVDLTEQKEAERNLKEALNKAEESDRLKSAFLANMSHEIRTPMNGILGFSQLLKEPNLEGEEQLKFIDIIEKSGNRMLNIINDLIDISKIEAGQAEVYISEVNVNEQIEYLYTFFKPEAENRGLQLSFKNTLSNPLATIQSDREKIYAILTNLIKNSIKYTNEGSIEFGYNLRKDREPAVLEFFVRDTGIGIAEEKLEAVFDRFVQADLSLASNYEGAGLGLAITKGYVEILGGNIWVESEEGKGSQFYFTLPYTTQSDQPSTKKTDIESTQESTQKKLNILIVEDDETSKIFLTALTKNICEKVTYAKTGIEAVDICKKKQNIDLILMDIKMPDLDGYEATKKIREFNTDVIIIAQTAYALEGDREKALEAGCNDYIAKPIPKDKLLEMVWKYMGE